MRHRSFLCIIPCLFLAACDLGMAQERASVANNVSSEGPRYFGYTLRTSRWRYTEWDEGRKGCELYDHDSDPRELTNLAESTLHAKTIDELSSQLKVAVKATFPPSGKTPEMKQGMWAPAMLKPTPTPIQEKVPKKKAIR